MFLLPRSAHVAFRSIVSLIIYLYIDDTSMCAFAHLKLFCLFGIISSNREFFQVTASSLLPITAYSAYSIKFLPLALSFELTHLTKPFALRPVLKTLVQCSQIIVNYSVRNFMFFFLLLSGRLTKKSDFVRAIMTASFEKHFLSAPSVMLDCWNSWDRHLWSRNHTKATQHSVDEMMRTQQSADLHTQYFAHWSN